MRYSPLAMAVMYVIIGIAFTYFGIQSTEGTLWNFFTILLAIFATFNYAVAIRLIGLHFRMKRNKNKKKK